MGLRVAIAIAVALPGCGSDPGSSGGGERDAAPIGDAEASSAPRDAGRSADAGDATSPDAAGTPFAMDFTRAASLYDAPFPSDDLRAADGHVDVSQVPNPSRVDLVTRSLRIIARDARGFSQAGAVYLRAGAAVDPATLPTLADSVTEGASVYLAAAPDYATRHPVDVAFLPDGGPMGDANLLAILPLQGVPLRPATRYAAVVTRRVRYADGTVPAEPAALADLRAGRTPPGLSDATAAAYREALADDVAALAVFTTDDRAADLATWRAAARPLVIAGPPALTETHDGYCVFESTVDVPVYQEGAPPYTLTGGDWGPAPRLDHVETGRIWFTVPRAPAPAAGYPTLVFIGTGGGGPRALVDRGYCDTPTFTAPVTPGSGPAQELARVGWAGVQIDGALEGLRNPNGGNEDFLIFNVLNPVALRDNLRQSALEIALLPDALAELRFDASACPGAGDFRADLDRLALMGHSMGASIAPLALAAEPRYRTVILSGAGASFIANVIDKELPVAVRPIAESLLRYRRPLVAHDPPLTLFQWAAEPADAQIYGRVLMPRNVLMLQGIVDHYILPNIANGTSLSLGLDLAGPPLDADLPGQRPLAPLLPFVGRSARALPVTDNAAGHTAVVVQHRGDALQDGHETVYQTEPPKSQYRCFLADVAAGLVPTVRDRADAPCW